MSETTPPPAGWYPDSSSGAHRWWDGEKWTEHLQAPPATAPRRRERRPRPTTYITREPVQTSHVFHLIMTLCTFGIWAFTGWPLMIVINSMRRRKIVTHVR